MTDSGKPDGAARLEFTVDADDAGARLDKWLSARAGALTRSRIKSLIEGGALARNGAPFADPAWKVRPGERFSLAPPADEDGAPAPETIPLDIRFEDADLLVLFKPAGLVVHPAAGNKAGTLVNALRAHCGASLSGVGGATRPGVVHRLDKDTSGLLVVAKNDRAHLALAAAFAAHAIERAYDAIATGCPRPGVGTIDAPLARSGADRKKMAVVNDDEDRGGGRFAVTHYRVRETFGRARAKLPGDALASLLECRLETGRTHQIRAHLAHIGHPIVGDPAYGRGPGLAGLKPGDAAADRALALLAAFRRQALHARLLGFTHPTSGEKLAFEAAPPQDFMALLAALRAL